MFAFAGSLFLCHQIGEVPAPAAGARTPSPSRPQDTSGLDRGNSTGGAKCKSDAEAYARARAQLLRERRGLGASHEGNEPPCKYREAGLQKKKNAQKDDQQFNGTPVGEIGPFEAAREATLPLSHKRLAPGAEQQPGPDVQRLIEQQQRLRQANLSMIALQHYRQPQPKMAAQGILDLGLILSASPAI